MISGIIFDLDGVLCSTDLYHYQAWKVIADDIGIAFTESDNAKLRGVSRMDSLNILLGKRADSFSIHDKQILAERKNAIYREKLSQMTEHDISPEIRLMLRNLKAKYRLAVGSSSKNTGYILAQTKIESFFDAVADGNEIKYSKPNPEVFLLAARKLSLRPEECVVVEDAPAGIEAAKAGGFISVALGKYVEDCEASFHIRHVTELAEILL